MEAMDQRTSNDRETVILVHGTFASSAEDAGDDWWQVGSATHRELSRRLPSNVSLAEEGQLFHWSGENNERARGKAAAELLEYLRPFEAEGKKYHLIGHSHGGSVIWSAMRLATARRTPLDHLGSWSTVGTPFLHHRSRSPRHVVNIFYLIIAAILLVPSARTLYTLAKLPFRMGSGEAVVIRNNEDAGIIVSAMRAPVIELLKGCGVPFTEIPDGIRVGSYEPNSGQSPAAFMFGTLEGWLIHASIVVFAYFTLLLGSRFTSPVIESLRIGWEKRIEERVFETYRSRWLGVWTHDDEAINGLRTTLDLSVSFVGRLVPRERIFLSDAISLITRPCYWVFAPLYNALIRPTLDIAIRGVVARSAQGNNRPAAYVVAVAPSPLIPPDAPSIPPLPEGLSQRILEEADRHACDIGPKIRQLLGQPSFTSGLDAFSHDLSGRELVHTSYFDHPEVLNLLTENIRWSQSLGSQSLGSQSLESSHRSLSTELAEWFDSYKKLLEEGNSSHLTDGSPLLQRQAA